MTSPPDIPRGDSTRTTSAAGETASAREADLRAWMERYGPALRRHFQKRGAAEEAEDLVQEVFLRLQASTSGAAILNVERYLFRIANNVLVSRHRHALVEGRPFQARLDDAIEPADEISPERVVMGRQALARLVVGLRALPPRTREAFLFHRFEEMTYPAIARRMGISVSAVEQLITRALEHLARSVGSRP